MHDGIFHCDSSSTIVSKSAATTAARFAARVFGETGLRLGGVRSACAAVKGVPELEEVDVGAGIVLDRGVATVVVTVEAIDICVAFLAVVVIGFLSRLSLIAVTVVVDAALGTSIVNDCCAFVFGVTVITKAAFANSCDCDVTLFEIEVELSVCVTIGDANEKKGCVEVEPNTVALTLV